MVENKTEKKFGVKCIKHKKRNALPALFYT